MTFSIFGDRVLLREPAAEADQSVGGIFVPESSTRAYVAMEVVSLGDGRVRAMSGVIQRTMSGLKVGERVLVQINPLMFGNNAQKVEGVKYLTLNYHDVIARIDTGIINLTLDTFHPVGRWVLVRIETPEKVGKIWLPDSKQPMQSAGEVKTFLAKAGDQATEELGAPPVGTRLLLEHSRVNPMQIARESFGYIDVGHVAGRVEVPDDLAVSQV